MGRPISFCKDKMTSYRRRNRSRTSPIQDYNKFVVIASRTKQPVQNRDEKDTVGLYKVGAVKYYEDLNTEQSYGGCRAGALTAQTTGHLLLSGRFCAAR